MKYFMRLKFTGIYKYLRTLIFVLASVVILSQFALTNDNTRKFLTGVDILDGTAPVSGEVFSKDGFVKLKLIEGDPSDDIAVLINGEQYCNFSTEEITVNIKGQSVIEVMNNSKKRIAVTAEKISDNVTATFNNGVVYVDDISVITRVVLK